MADPQVLNPIVDLVTAPLPITQATIQQLVATTQPYTAGGIGFVIYADAAPDAITYPALAKFLWVRTVAGVPNGEVYYYNTGSWSLFRPTDFIDGSLTLPKISRAGAQPLDLLQVNASNTALQWTAVLNALVNGTVPLNKLVGGGSGYGVFVSVNGTNVYLTIAQLQSLFTPLSSITLAMIPGGLAGNNQMLVSLLGVVQYVDIANVANYIISESLLFSALAASGATAGQTFRRNASNNGWEAFTPVIGSIITLGPQALPVGAGANTFLHGQASAPLAINVTSAFVCIFAEHGYAIGDTPVPAIGAPVIDTLNITIPWPDAANTVILPKGGGAPVVMTRAYWNARVYIRV